MRQEYKQRNYCNIKDYVPSDKPNATPKPMFYIGDKKFNMISWNIMDISIEHKEITPSSGKNAGKKIKVHNLIIDMLDDEWEISLQMDLYSQIARNIINVLAGWYSFDKEIFFSVYLNKAGYRTISIKDGWTTDSNYIDGKYSFEEINNMVEMKIDKWEEVKDYDWLMDKLVKELMPIIEKKINDIVPEEKTETVEETRAKVEVQETLQEKAKAKQNEDNDDLPF